MVVAALARLVASGIIAGALTTGLVVTPGTAGAGTRPAGADSQAAGTRGSSLPLSLSAQTAYVAPDQPFDVRVQPGRGSPPASELGLTVAVYACLSSVSAFDQSVSSASGPAGTRISATRSPVPLSGLPVSGGVYDLSMQVVQGGTTPAPSTGPFTIDLTTTGAQCGAYPYGVYPVRVELVDTASGQVLGGFTTHLVYVSAPAGTQRLQVALVLPVQTTLQASAAPTPSALRERPQAALAPPSATAVDAVTATVDTIAGHASVPLTIEASPQTVDLLSSTGHEATVGQLASLAAGPTGSHQFAASPFVPVDAANLVDAGLQVELNLQVAQGVQTLDTTRPPIPAPGGAGPGKLGTWFSDTALDPATLTQLQGAGYDQVVLPATSLSSVPTNGSTAEPFTLSSTRGTDMATLAFNSDISGRFPTAAADPVLAAHQLVAELAQTYYEKPNDATARGVLAVAPSGWPDNPVFVDALLGALQPSPILQPVTTATLFDTLGPATSCRACRLATPAGTGGLPVTAIRTQRQRINGLVGRGTGAPGRSDRSSARWCCPDSPRTSGRTSSRRCWPTRRPPSAPSCPRSRWPATARSP